MVEGFDWVLTTNAAEQSEAPPSFEPALETEDFILWQPDRGGDRRRGGPCSSRSIPGAGLDCSGPNGRLAEVGGNRPHLPA